MTQSFYRMSFVVMVTVTVFLAGFAEAAVMTGTNFKIERDSVNVGGDVQSSASYKLHETQGESGTGNLSGAANTLFGGFRMPDPPTGSVAGAVAGGGGATDLLAPLILDITIEDVTDRSVEISWRTSELALSQIYYGTDTHYEKSLIGTDRLSYHFVILEPLEPDTDYFFEIVAEDKLKNRGVSGPHQFRTLDTVPPENVIELDSIPSTDDITLVWQNPSDEDFEQVTIVRSTDFFPIDPTDGETIYVGTGQQFIDTDVEQGKRYYYSAFAQDKKGNVTSGAVTTAVPVPIVIPGEPLPPAPPIFPEPPFTDEIPDTVTDLDLADFIFLQSGREVSSPNGVTIHDGAPVTILLDYNKVPEVLKTILVTLEQGAKTFSFLLRVDEEKKHYLAKLAPPDAGSYGVRLSVMDYKNQELKQFETDLAVIEAPEEVEVSYGENSRIVQRHVGPQSGQIIFWLIIIVAIIICMGRRARRRIAKDASTTI